LATPNLKAYTAHTGIPRGVRMPFFHTASTLSREINQEHRLCQ
jgi:hypothetical protein